MPSFLEKEERLKIGWDYVHVLIVDDVRESFGITLPEDCRMTIEETGEPVVIYWRSKVPAKETQGGE